MLIRHTILPGAICLIAPIFTASAQATSLSALVQACYSGSGTCNINLAGKTYPVTSTVQIDPYQVSLSTGNIVCAVPAGTACLLVATELTQQPSYHVMHALRDLSITSAKTQTGTGLYIGTASNTAMYNWDMAIRLENISIRNFNYGLDIGSNTYALDASGLSIGDNAVGIHYEAAAVNSGERNTFVASTIYENTVGFMDELGAETAFVSVSFDFNTTQINTAGPVSFVQSHIENNTQANPEMILTGVQGKEAGKVVMDPATSITVDGYDASSPSDACYVQTNLPWGGVVVSARTYGFAGTSGAICGPGVSSSYNWQSQPWNNATMSN